MLWRNPHRRFQERLSAYLDGELSPTDAVALESHLDSCDSCREEMAQISFFASALAELPGVDAPRSFALTPEHVAQPAAQPQAMRSVNSGLRMAGSVLAAALAVVLVLDIGGVVGNGGRVDDGGATLQRSAEYDMASGAVETPVAPISEAADGSGGVGGADSGVDGLAASATAALASPLPPEGHGRDEVPQPTAAPLPARGEPTGEVVGGLGLNGSEEGDTETLTSGDSSTDSGDGLSALTVTEIVLAALLGASLIGIGAATYAGRRRA